jgi:hypothetical protein
VRAPRGLLLQNYGARRDERDAELARLRRDRALLRQRLEDTEWSLCQRAGEIALLKTQLKEAQVNQSDTPSIFLFPTLIPLSRVGTTCFHRVAIKIRQLFLRPAACLTSSLLENGVDANGCKCSRDQQFNGLPKHGGTRNNKFWSLMTFTNDA